MYYLFQANILLIAIVMLSPVCVNIGPIASLVWPYIMQAATSWRDHKEQLMTLFSESIVYLFMIVIFSF